MDALRRLVVLGGCCALAAASPADGIPYWYNGDFDGRSGLASWWNTSNGVRVATYDDFEVGLGGTRITGVWANFLTRVPNVQQAYYEIRANMRPGYGGELLASGDIPITQRPTGRGKLGDDEYQLAGLIPTIDLPAGRYWLTMCPVVDGQGSLHTFLSTTSGADEGPPQDPNPPPVGSPRGNNHNSIFYYWDTGFWDTQNVLGIGTWDFSMGIEIVPEASAAIALLLPLVFCRRRAGGPVMAHIGAYCVLLLSVGYECPTYVVAQQQCDNPRHQGPSTQLADPVTRVASQGQDCPPDLPSGSACEESPTAGSAGITQSPCTGTDSCVDANENCMRPPVPLTKFRNWRALGPNLAVTDRPPDPGIAVGPTQVVVTTNDDWAIYSKSGSKLFCDDFNHWFEEPGLGFLDPKCFYDTFANRFVIVVITQTRPAWCYVATSDDSDALGQWRYYRFSADLNGSESAPNIPDYTYVG